MALLVSHAWHLQCTLHTEKEEKMLKSTIKCALKSVAFCKILNCLLTLCTLLFVCVCVCICAFLAHGLGVSESEGASNNTTRTEANGHLYT